MSEPTPQKQKKQPTITEIDPEVYKRLCEVVEAGTFLSINFSPWHKGCDVELDATCQWPELEGELETWYYDRRGDCDIDMHTMATINPSYDGETLSFHLDAIWDRSLDQMSEVDQGWDEMEFQEFVHSLLPSTMEENVTPDDIWISLELEYLSAQDSSISDFSISIDGDESGELTDSVNQIIKEEIREYVISWCMANHTSENDVFNISINYNSISYVCSICPSEEFLLIPKEAEETDS
jgi:hypothetical protein